MRKWGNIDGNVNIFMQRRKHVAACGHQGVPNYTLLVLGQCTPAWGPAGLPHTQVVYAELTDHLHVLGI